MYIYIYICYYSGYHYVLHIFCGGGGGSCKQTVEEVVALFNSQVDLHFRTRGCQRLLALKLDSWAGLGRLIFDFCKVWGLGLCRV